MRSVSILILALFALVGCSSGDDKTTSSPGDTPKDSGEIQKVRYAGSLWYGHAPVWVGIQKGFFKDAGFEVELVAGATSAGRIDLLTSDGAEFSSLGQVAMLAAMSRDRRGFVWIGNQNIAPGNEGIVARAGIEDIKGLKGKKVGFTRMTSAHLTLGDMLKQNGMSMADITPILAKPDDIVSSLKGGSIDAGITWEPHYANLKKIEGVSVFATDKDTSFYKTHKTMSGPDVICVSEKWFNADAARTKRFFQAYFKSVQWCADNPEELVELVAKHVGKESEIEVVRAAMKNFEWLGWDKQIDALDKLRGQSKDAVALMLEMKEIEKAPKVEDWIRFKLYQE